MYISSNKERNIYKYKDRIHRVKYLKFLKITENISLRRKQAYRLLFKIVYIRSVELPGSLHELDEVIIIINRGRDGGVVIIPFFS